MKKIMVTGSAGFIGAAVAERLLKNGDSVLGLDNHNDYYAPELKQRRVSRLEAYANYSHLRLDVADEGALSEAFSDHEPSHVVHLAAQAGVRYSLEKPGVYLQSNVVGFANVLEFSKKHAVEHLVYASSSSVYGGNVKLPFTEDDEVSRPLSVYAATKRANELLAYTYSHLFGLATTGLRFFTVYGPWGRPDMALYRFTKAILAGEPIHLFNGGDHRRDFTYIDDVVDGVVAALDRPPGAGQSEAPVLAGQVPARLLNLGSGRPIELMAYVRAIEKATGLNAKTIMLPPQPGDVHETFADISMAERILGYQPRFTVEEGVAAFVTWLKDYTGLDK